MSEPNERPYHHGDLKRALLDTALLMLQEKNGWQFTLRELARRAEVSHAAPYKHFPDKAALLAELALIGFDRLSAALAAARPATHTSLQDTFLPMANAYLDFAIANPELYRLMFGADIGSTVELHLHERALTPFSILTGLLQEGQAAGTIRPRPVQGQAAACWAQLHGLAMLKLDGLLLPRKVGEDATGAALSVLLEGLAR